MSRRLLAYIAPAALGAALAVGAIVPVRNEVVKTRYVARSVTRHDRSVSYIAESSKDFPQRLMAYDIWPELRRLQDGDILAYKKTRWQTAAGLISEALLNKRIRFLEWQQLEIEVVKQEK